MRSLFIRSCTTSECFFCSASSFVRALRSSEDMWAFSSAICLSLASSCWSFRVSCFCREDTCSRNWVSTTTWSLLVGSRSPLVSGVLLRGVLPLANLAAGSRRGLLLIPCSLPTLWLESEEDECECLRWWWWFWLEEEEVVLAAPPPEPEDDRW